MNFLIKALNEAAQTSTKVMTSEVRRHAVKQGWEPEVANGISISVAGDNLSYDLGTEHKDRAFVHEFGDERKQPKATIRRYLNKLDDVKELFPKIYMHHLKK